MLPQKKMPLLAILHNHKLQYRLLAMYHPRREECTNETLQVSCHLGNFNKIYKKQVKTVQLLALAYHPTDNFAKLIKLALSDLSVEVGNLENFLIQIHLNAK